MELTFLDIESGHFVKKFCDSSEEELLILERHYSDIEKIFEKDNNTVVPKLINVNRNEFRFQLIDLGLSFNKAIDANNAYELGHKASIILNKIHDKNDLLHGDFVMHNLFINDSDGSIFLIDPNPPSMIHFDVKMLYGNQAIDLVSMVYSIIDSFGLKNIFVNLKIVNGFLRGFLKTLPNYTKHQLSEAVSLYKDKMIEFNNNCKKNWFRNYMRTSLMVLIIKTAILVVY